MSRAEVRIIPRPAEVDISRVARDPRSHSNPGHSEHSEETSAVTDPNTYAKWWKEVSDPVNEKH